MFLVRSSKSFEIMTFCIAAIEFALTLEYRNLRAVERSALLHQGKQGPDPSYVEIVFDNKDRKLPVSRWSLI
jgi:chromosome segregation ATPase